MGLFGKIKNILFEDEEEVEETMPVFTKDEVISLFSEFEIINFKEVEKDGTTGLNEMKHWHLFIVIAKKK